MQKRRDSNRTRGGKDRRDRYEEKHQGPPQSYHHPGESRNRGRDRSRDREDFVEFGDENKGKRPKKFLRKERYPFFKKRYEKDESQPRFIKKQQGHFDEGEGARKPKKPVKRREEQQGEAMKGEAKPEKAPAASERQCILTDEDVIVAKESSEVADVEGAKAYRYGEHLAFDEDREHEFKSVTHAIDPIDRISQLCDEYVNAFLNTDGGYIYFGIEDDGTIVGLPLSQRERDLLRLRVDGYISMFRPQVDPYLFRMSFYKVLVHEGAKVLRPPLDQPGPHSKKRSQRKASRNPSRQANPNALSSPFPGFQYRIKQQVQDDNLSKSHPHPTPHATPQGSPQPPSQGAPAITKTSPSSSPKEEEFDIDDYYDSSRDYASRSEESSGDSAESTSEEEEEGELEETIPENKEIKIESRVVENPPKPSPATSPKEKEKEKGETVVDSSAVQKEGGPSKGVKGYRYMVEVAVGRGRAPVYFNSRKHAFFRLSGSIHQMKDSMIDERKLMGRPPLANEPVVGTPTPLPTTNATPNALVSSGGVEVELVSPRGVEFPGPVDFIGRQKEIQLVKDFVFNTPHESNSVTILLYGSPVVGKSALARHLVRELSQVYNGSHYTINMKGVSTPYISILDAMISVIRHAYPMRALPESESEIKGIYQSCFNANKCILLIENAGTVTQVQELIPKMSTEKNVVLVTSRRDIALDVVIEDTLSIRLSALEPADAISLVQALVPEISVTQAKEISELCAYLPLPIRLVGSTIRRKLNVNIDGMIKRLKGDSNQFLELLEHMMGLSAEEMYPEEVRSYMFMLSVFPSGFDGPAAQAILQKSYEETEDILGLLIEYSLLDFRLNTGRYQMNDLVRLYCSKKLEERDKGKSATSSPAPSIAVTAAGGQRTEPLQISEPSIKEIQTRFINYYLKMLEELVKLKSCALMKAAEPPSEELAPCMLCFVKERKNFEVSIKYAMGLKNFRLAWQLSKNMMLFVKDLDSMENRKWHKVVGPVVESENVKEVSKKEKEDEKNNRGGGVAVVGSPPSTTTEGVAASLAACIAENTKEGGVAGQEEGKK